ncbi:MAG: tripartite tricarboxylate transporter substrate binding protein [Candidatus Rokubacteria bacterium]|nr:tripartite tricarboxylate transporter substrate binding protein [Candidatus Rokubacteria bacterium]
MLMRSHFVSRSLTFLGSLSLLAAACGGAPTGGTTSPAATAAATAAGSAAATAVALVAPTKPVEFVISTAPGGGSDIYARVMQGIIDKNKLSPQPVTPVNKDGGSGAVAFQYVFDKKGDAGEIMITLNSFFTTLIVQKLSFKATDFTPVANLALDPFYLWVNEDSPWKNAGDFIAAAKADALVVAGTGSKQEDEALFRRIQTLAGTKAFNYVPQSGGGTVAAALAGHQAGVVATVNNPSEGKALYAGTPRKLRPLCTFEPAGPTAGTFAGLATCKSQGLAIDDYFIVRSIMAAPGISAGQQAFWVDLFKKVYESAEWKKFMADNELKPDFRSGADFAKLIADYQKLHEDIAKQFNWVQ